MNPEIELEYSSDFDTLYPIVEKTIGLKEMVWHGNLYLHLNKYFQPMITGWLRLEKDSESIPIRLLYKDGKWIEV